MVLTKRIPFVTNLLIDFFFKYEQFGVFGFFVRLFVF